MQFAYYYYYAAISFNTRLALDWRKMNLIEFRAKHKISI